jgi:hypothetical protein
VFRATLFKASTLADGRVSVVLHVEESDADIALNLRKTRGMVLNVTVD